MIDGTGPQPDPPPFRAAAVRGIVFDLDGTLVDSYAPITTSLNHARHGFGLPPLDEGFVRMRVGRGLESLVAELVDPDGVQRAVRLFRQCYARVYADGTRALPGAVEAVTRLRDRGYRLSVASNKPARFSRPIVEACGLGPFDAVLGPDEAGAAKPDPRMIEACLEAMGVDRSGALYVGDMVLDAISGAAAEVPVVLVEGGSSPLDALRETGLTVLHGLSELCGHLGGCPLSNRGDPGITAG